MPTLLLLLGLTSGIPTGTNDACDWRFVLPEPGDPHEHPPFRALGLAPRRPDDLIETVAYRGHRRRYGQLRFGSPSSIRVTIVLDEAAPGVADLYVDADRNRRIEPRDRVAGSDRVWRLPLDVAIVEGEAIRFESRAAVLRLGATGSTLGFAAAGYLEGSVRLGDHERRARRLDGDGDGQFTGPQDRLWIDRDGDGHWDPLAEQFLFRPILELAGVRFALRSDPFGHRLLLEPLKGTGSVRLSLVHTEGAARVVSLSVTLIGRDGSAFSLDGDGVETTLPAGDYRLGAVLLTLEDPAGGPIWRFVFSDSNQRGEPPWYPVANGSTVMIDPIGSLAFATGLDAETDPPRPGDALSFRPSLVTSGGLSIVTCYRGSPTAPAADDGPSASIALETSDGRVLATARSGFL